MNDRVSGSCTPFPAVASLCQHRLELLTVHLCDMHHFCQFLCLLLSVHGQVKGHIQRFHSGRSFSEVVLRQQHLQ